MKFNRKSLARMAVLSSILGFSSFANVLNADEVDRCMICLDAMSLKDGKAGILSCGHMLHLECYGIWHNNNKTCPKCRRDQGASVGKKIDISRGCDNCKGHEKLIPTTSGKTLCYDCLKNNLNAKAKVNVKAEFIEKYELNKGDATNIYTLLGIQVTELPEIPDAPVTLNNRGNEDRDLNRNVRFGKLEEGVDIGLEESELRKLGGEEAVRLANENKNIDNKLVDLNKHANKMLDNGKFDFYEFNKLFDTAEVCRAQKMINYNDVGDLFVHNNMQANNKKIDNELVDLNAQANKMLDNGKFDFYEFNKLFDNAEDFHDQMINYNNVDDLFVQNNMVLVAE